MIITEKQLIILHDLAKWFIRYEFNGFCPPYERDTVITILDQIINQQSNVLLEVK